MSDNEEFMRFLASWALVHETADEGWKAAVARGLAQESGDMESGPEAFVDGLSAIIAERKELLKVELAQSADGDTTHLGVGERLDELRFEVGELRGRFESMQATLDAILERTKSSSSGGTPGKA